MTKRMLAALIALCGLLVALYLTLFKLGIIGELACGVGSCEAVQTSRWATFLGFPVAAWGLGYYATVLTLTLAGLGERFELSRALSLALLVLAGWGVLFSLWLTYLELFVIHAICQWCVVSALLAVALFVVVALDWLELRTAMREMATAASEE